MNYGISIIIIAVLDVLVLISGLPTGWKKGIVIILSIILAFLGWTIRIVESRRAMRIKARAKAVEESNVQEFSSVAQTIAHDVTETVEHEIDTITHNSDYHSHAE